MSAIGAMSIVTIVIIVIIRSPLPQGALTQRSGLLPSTISGQKLHIGKEERPKTGFAQRIANGSRLCPHQLCKA